MSRERVAESTKTGVSSSSSQQRAATRTRDPGVDEAPPALEETESGWTAGRHPLMQLQESRGNQAVQRAVKERIRPKVELGEPSDRYEREAGRVADQVTRGAGPVGIDTPVGSESAPRVQRACKSCRDRNTQEKLLIGTRWGMTEKVQRAGSIQISRVPRARGQGDEVGTESAAAPSFVTEVFRPPGRPLDTTTRRLMEGRFGHDFSRIRVYTGAKAAASSRAISARAYTVGQDIAFGAREYQPQTNAGQTLLAHELTHTIQQSRVGSASVQRSTTRGAGGCGPPRQIDEDNSGARNAGADAHTQIQSFLLRKGVLPELEIPRATKRHIEQTGCQPESRNNGFADLWKPGGVVRIGEIKPIGSAERLAVPEAEHYIRRATQSVDRITGSGSGPNRCGHQSRGADDDAFASIIGMLGPISTRTRFSKLSGVLPTQTVIGPFDGDPARTLKAKLTSPGAVGYWCTGGTSETLPCDASSEEITAYIDRILSAAEHEVDEFVERRFVQPIDEALDDMDIRRLLTMGNNYFGSQIRSLLAERFGVPTFVIPELDQSTIDRISQVLETQMNSTVRSMIRVIIRRLKNRILGELRQQLRNGLRNMLRQAITAVCVGAPVVTLAHVLEKLNELLENEARRLVPVVVQTVLATIAVEMVRAIAKAVGEAMRTVGNFILRALAVIGIILAGLATLLLAIATLVTVFDPVPGDEAALGVATAAVAAVIPLLIHFVRTGEVPEEPESA